MKNTTANPQPMGASFRLPLGRCLPAALLALLLGASAAAFQWLWPDVLLARIALGLALLMLLAALELATRRVVLGPEALQVRDGLRGWRIERGQIRGWGRQQPTGLMLELMDGRHVDLPQLGPGDGQLAEKLPGWLQARAA